jgi:mannose-1-phosphate guanylyltransferase
MPKWSYCRPTITCGTKPLLLNLSRRPLFFAATSCSSIHLLGIEPDETDTELGYIIPSKRRENGASYVSKFVEKPTLAAARALRRQGALWNAFILAAPVRQFIKLYEKRFAATTADMAALSKIDPSTPRSGWLISGLYQRLDSVDFSRDVLEGQEPMLRVLTVPNCKMRPKAQTLRR